MNIWSGHLWYKPRVGVRVRWEEVVDRAVSHVVTQKANKQTPRSSATNKSFSNSQWSLQQAIWNLEWCWTCGDNMGEVVDRWAVGKLLNQSNCHIRRANSSALRLYTSQAKPSILTKVPSLTSNRWWCSHARQQLYSQERGQIILPDLLSSPQDQGYSLTPITNHCKMLTWG